MHVDHTSAVKKRDHQKFVVGFALSGLLGFGRASILPLGTLSLGLWVIMLYTHLQHHNDTIIKTQWITHARSKTLEDFFNKIFTSHFICKFRKGCSKFACERELETEHNWNILTPKLWPSALCPFLPQPSSWPSSRWPRITFKRKNRQTFFHQRDTLSPQSWNTIWT